MFEARGIITKKLYAQGKTKADVHRQLNKKYDYKLHTGDLVSSCYNEPLLIFKGEI